MKRLRSSAAIVLGITAATIAFGDCPDGVRNTTEAEQTFETATLERLAALVPPPPAGWELKKNPIYRARTSVCKGTDPSRVVYTASYTWVDGLKEMQSRNEARDRKVAELRRMPEDQAAEYAEIGKQARALRRDAGKSRAIKNLQEADRLEQEAKSLEAKAARIKDAHKAATQPRILEYVKESLAAEDGKSYNVNLFVAANERPDPAIAKSIKDTTELALGAAKPLPGRLKVQSVIVRWTGNPAQTKQFSTAFDQASAAKLMQ